jgi:N-acetylmuramoyl-L-alanine amidase
MKRNIKYLVVHCTATIQDTPVNTFKEEGTDQPLYHFVIKPDGDTVRTLPEYCISGLDCAKNSESIHVAYIGGVDKMGKPIDNRTGRQRDALFCKLLQLWEKYPHAMIKGNCDMPDKKGASPCFDVKAWLGNYIPDLTSSHYFEDEELLEQAA